MTEVPGEMFVGLVRVARNDYGFAINPHRFEVNGASLRAEATVAAIRVARELSEEMTQAERIAALLNLRTWAHRVGHVSQQQSQPVTEPELAQVLPELGTQLADQLAQWRQIRLLRPTALRRCGTALLGSPEPGEHPCGGLRPPRRSPGLPRASCQPSCLTGMNASSRVGSVVVVADRFQGRSGTRHTPTRRVLYPFG
jgi:hypothetical protein